MSALLDKIEGAHYLMTVLLYGTGMRLMECIRLRVQDLDFEYQQIYAREQEGSLPFFLRSYLLTITILISIE